MTTQVRDRRRTHLLRRGGLHPRVLVLQELPRARETPADVVRLLLKDFLRAPGDMTVRKKRYLEARAALGEGTRALLGVVEGLWVCVMSPLDVDANLLRGAAP